MIDELRWLFLVLMVGDMHGALFGSRVSFSKAHKEEIQRLLNRQETA